jgi:Hepatocellular carcinoma-associated antigen 59
MVYIEENMKLRRGQAAQQSADSSTGASASTAAQAGGNAQDDLFSKLDPRYKVERKSGEEGSVTNSLSMLTAIPEVDLGMEFVPSILQFPLRSLSSFFFFSFLQLAHV